MDVATLVRSITSSFEDAAALVKRIRDQGEAVDNAIDELIDSLDLGPVVVNGYFNSDAKRFGEPYTSGDHYAKEQLKDVLIHLQRTVLTTLRLVLVDDKELDCISIQAASDDCRVNAGVSLGQLSQRLADPIRAQQYATPNTSFPFRLATPPLKYSQSIGSASSEGPRTPTTPELEVAMADLDYPGRLPGFVPQTPTHTQSKAFAVLQGSPEFPVRKPVPNSAHNTLSIWERRQTDTDEVRARSKTSSLQSNEEQPKFSPVSPIATYEQWSRMPPTSGTVPSQVPDRGVYATITERSGPDDADTTKTPSYQIAAIKAQHPPLTTPHPALATPQQRERAHSGGTWPSPTRSSVSQDFSQYRPTVSSRRSDSISSSRNYYGSAQALASRSSTSVNAPIPVHTDEDAPPLPTPPIPSKSPARGNEVEPLRRGARKILGDVDLFLDRFVNDPVMPTENDMMGYCKGAFRLQIGLEKKAFKTAQRPVGMAGFMPYWKCEKCYFEGPVKLAMDKTNKPEKVFDQSIREFDGIRFKWIFLAKCHVPMKSNSNRPDGTAGSFGCIFCTAESKARQWNIAGMSSVGKGKNAHRDPRSSDTPVFGNSSSFMEHLQFHRNQNYWPNREMQKKMKCIVGRVARPDEDFDINFMPLEVEIG